MINRFRDHAANERTYLAWIRTAVAIMAFGFLVEKFDIFVSYVGHTMGSMVRFKPSMSVEYIGLGLMFIAVSVILGSTIRFFHHKKAIESEQPMMYHAKWPNIVLALLMMILASFLSIYMIMQVLKLESTL